MGVNTDRRFLCYSNIFCVFYHNFLSCRKVFCLHVCLCLSGDSGGQKGLSHCLELVLLMAVRCSVSDGSQTQVLCKHSRCS